MDVVIAGGGTAGWIAAFTILRGTNVKSVTVVEPSKIGIIGAGEAASGALLSLLEDVYTNNDDVISGSVPRVDFVKFFQETKAMPKFGILHKDWAKTPGDYYGPINSTHTAEWNTDVAFLHAVAKFGNRKSHMGSELGLAYEMKKMPVGDDGAVHFDGNKFAVFMKNFLSYDSRLKVIDAPINDVELDAEGNIENLVLDDGSRVGGDFFVDATGFKRLLMNKLDVGWVSYKDVLPVDRAIPFFLKYGVGDMVQPLTVAQAMDSGWMWKTPLQHRRGAGYTYSSEFLDEDGAQEEVEKKLGRKIEPIASLKFDSGKLKDFWVKNCMSVGLASSFIEPLEATSIHATVMQAVIFTREFMAPTRELTLKESNKRFYNKRIHEMMESYKDFTVLHYQGGRTDTPFWRSIVEEKKTTDVVEDYIEKSKSLIPSTFLFNDKYGVDSLWKWSLAGLDLISQKDAIRQLKHQNIYHIGKKEFMAFYEHTEQALMKSDTSYIKVFEINSD